MSIAFDLVCLHVLFNIPCAALLSVIISVAGCGCPNSSRVCLIGTAYFAFMKTAAISASAADDTTFFIILATTCIAPLFFMELSLLPRK